MNNQDQSSMKMAIKMFSGFRSSETQRSKFGPIFSNKVREKLLLSKYVNNKNCSPIFIFFNEKKTKKFRLIFDIENWLKENPNCAMQTVGRDRGAKWRFLALLVDLIYWVTSEWNLRNLAEGTVVGHILHYLPLTKGYLQIRTFFSRIWLPLLQFYSNLFPNRSLDFWWRLGP